ncbi:MAG: hypothetical protein J6386_08045 [Candidatus Synoicihabitans palmerolidicus]|nr:hypothetical protein [Candidatus Synoicihabitans palmerolidicus]
MITRLPSFRWLLASTALAIALPLHANTAITPAHRNPQWVARHDGFLKIPSREQCAVVVLGDSITDAWRKGPPKGGKSDQGSPLCSLAQPSISGSAETAPNTCLGASPTVNSTDSAPGFWC